MNSKSKITIICSIASVVVLIAAVTATWFLVGGPDSLPLFNEGGNVEEITQQAPTSSVTTTRPETTTLAPTTTTEVPTTEMPTKSEAEKYVEQFMAEANTYSQTVEVTTTPKGQKPFFHIVTDGTVSDDASLEGLDGVVKTVGQVILAAGFRYDKEQGIFYSESESWQRNFGFTPIYDAAAAFTGMYYDTMRIKFNHDNRDWMFQIWKADTVLQQVPKWVFTIKIPVLMRNFMPVQRMKIKSQCHLRFIMVISSL